MNNSIRTIPSARHGFTLVELMISIAIVLVLMLGINFVFTTSAKTISGGMALTDVSRSIRGTRRVFEADFGNAVSAKRMPALIIHNEAVYAFRDRQDKLSDSDGLPWTYDIDGEEANGDEILMEPAGLLPPNPPSPIISTLYPGLYNFRRHRIDRISFFAENGTSDYLRQTGDSNTYVQQQTSPEAWIKYGLMRIPDNDNDGTPDYWKPGARGNFTAGAFPDEQVNHNNFFATQWMLSRNVTLLKDEQSLPLNATFMQPPWLAFDTTAQQVNAVGPVTSAAYNRESGASPNPYSTVSPWRVQESRVDFAGTNLTELRQTFVDMVDVAPAALPAWWQDADPTTLAATTNRDRRAYNDTSMLPGVQSYNYLAWGKPFVDKSLNSTGTFVNQMANQTREAALTTPIFVKGCMQFIVEFAGDFYDQGPSVPAGIPERLGRIDYENEPGGTGLRTRWYGAPRDVDGNGTIDVLPVSVPPVAGTGAGARLAMRRWETVPASAPNTNPPPPFENAPPADIGTKVIYAWAPTESGPLPLNAPPKVGVAGAIPASGAPPAAWPGGFAGYGTPGDSNSVRPSLIRITMQVIDANGRLADAPSVEYVFRLPSVNDE